MESVEKRPLYVGPSGGRREVYDLLEASNLAGALAEVKRVLVKPNLVGTHRPPITTPVGLVASIVEFINERTDVGEIVVGDGTGNLEYDTWMCFDELGYRPLAANGRVRLTDLNDEPLVRLVRPELTRWPEFYLPRIVMESFLISVPVLKAHTLADVTLSMKNLIGAAPPAHYQCGGRWKKSSFHDRMHEAILDLNRYRTPDFTVLDATEGMKEAHLWGDTLRPAPGLLVATFDPVSADAYGADLLGKDYNNIGHIAGAHGELGSAEPETVVRV